jgi:hypothetical protein
MELNIYLLTWVETNTDSVVEGRAELVVSEDAALLFAAALNSDARFSDVVLLRREDMVTDLSDEAKSSQPATKN